MIDVPFPESQNYSDDMAQWLNQYMPNPSLPEPQRWGLVFYSLEQRVGIQFANEQDAILFILRWS